MQTSLTRIKEMIAQARSGDDFLPKDFPPKWNYGDISVFLERYNSDYTQCDTCSKWHTSDTYDTPDGSSCQSCVEEDFEYCPHCEKYERPDEFRKVYLSEYDSNSHEFWCDSCYSNATFYCEYCEKTFSQVTVNTVHYGDDYLCPACYEEHYFTCQACETVLPNERYCEDGHCYSCWEEEEGEEQAKVLRNYSTEAESCLTWGKPEPVGRFVNQKLYFGMELEVLVRSRNSDHVQGAARDLLSHFNNEVVLCEDGSLDDEGFEIKTPPLSKAELVELAGRITDCPAVKPLMSHDGGKCGLHVHLTRKALSPLQQGKIIEFVHKKGNMRLLKTLARRYSTENDINGNTNWCRYYPSWDKKKITKTWTEYHRYERHAVKVDRAKSSSVNDEKYHAVNFKYHTVELRVFRGTLKKTTLLACLEFVHALVTYTRTGEGENSKLTTEEFLAWLVAKPNKMKEWGNLCRFLVAKKFLPESVLPKVKPGVQQAIFPIPALANPEEIEEDAA